MEWISVKDRLPGTDIKNVIVFKYDKSPVVASFVYNKDEGVYYFRNEDDGRQLKSPDFWMPLPQLPKREGNVFFVPDCPCGLKITGGSKRT